MSKYDQTTVERLRQYMDHGDWRKGEQIALETGIKTRIIRQICERTGLLVQSSVRGYKRADLATTAEVASNRRTLMSRSNKLVTRAMLTQDVFEQGRGA